MSVIKAKKQTTFRVGRPPNTQRLENIRDNLLDVAEEIFAKYGFPGATIKQIARHAKVTTTLLHYYFQDKQGLLESVLSRRSDELIRLRMAALEHYEMQKGSMTLEGILETFIGPVFKLAIDGGVKLRNYFAIMAQVNNTPGWGAEIMAKVGDPSIQRSVELVCKVYPTAPRQDIYWGFLQFTGSLMLVLAQTGRIDRWSNGSCRSSDLQTAFPQVLAYAVGGFRAVCER